MEDTLLFIPPCCVDKKLPIALMHAPHRALTFYTHGDVTMEKFYRAVSYLVEDAHTMVLTMPIISAETAVFLQQCFERGWITQLALSTNNNATQVVERYLSAYRDRILYAQSNDVSSLSSHMVLYTAERALVLCGPMYEHLSRERLVSYSMVFYPMFSIVNSQHDWGNPLRNVIFPDVLRHRKKMNKVDREKLRGTLNHLIHLEFPPYDNE